MNEYPMNQIEFEEYFSTEQKCQDYLIKTRWKNGFICPMCNNNKYWNISQNYTIKCCKCKKYISVLAGTIFQDTHLSLMIWFRAIWWITNQKTGISALGLKNLLVIKHYKSSWLVLQKLRHIMVNPNRKLLNGIIEVDETFIGGKKSGKRGRGAGNKILTLIAAEKKGQGIGRIRLKRVTNASHVILSKFIKQNILQDSKIITDKWKGYKGIENYGFKHECVEGDSVGEEEILPRIHRVASLLKRWLLGTHQGAIYKAHIDYYLDEFVFRFNRRKSKYRGKLFLNLLEQAVNTEPILYKEIIL